MARKKDSKNQRDHEKIKNINSAEDGAQTKSNPKSAASPLPTDTNTAPKKRKSSKATTESNASKKSADAEQRASVADKAPRKKSAAQASKTDSAKTKSATKSKENSCRVVAIGASAGGLEPFEKFFDNMRVDSGLAFVVIQHLSPDFRSMMDELLNRHSAMKICRVEAGMELEPNTIYLNPPRVDMVIKNGKFALKSLPSRNTLHLPINVFMSSLAEEHGEKAIAIILSGTGSDGTEGAKAIRANNGTVLVQDPATAKFDGMPNSVLDALSADAVATPKELALLVSRLAQGEPIRQKALEQDTEPKDRVFQLLRDRFGTDFSHYKNATIERRLQRRSELLGFAELSDYILRLENDDEEAEALYADFLIEVTEFFRDELAFDALRKDVIPKLVDSMGPERPLRIWIPGCASGEEAYSIAISLAEEARKKNVQLNVKILATDIHHRSLEAANFGVYQKSALEKMSQELVGRYFERVGDNYQIRTFLRQMVVFSVHNILRDPPFTKIDLVSCRNLLIYLNDTAQQKALAYFHFSLIKGGHLFLGPSETVGELSSEFELIDQRWRIFVKRRNVRLIESMTQLPRNQDSKHAVPISAVGAEPNIVRGDAKRVYDRALDIVLKKYAPPGFLLKRTGEIVRVFGDAGRFLEVMEGNFSQRLDDLIRQDLRVVASAALDRAKSPQLLPFERKVRSRVVDAKQSSLTVRLEPVNDSRNESDLLLLTINEVARTVVIPDLDELEVQTEDLETVTLLRQRIEDLEHELRGSEETLQTTIEELETSNEELQATNEELMASNEELQSTNEELHSVNEELYTVSAEHQRKIIELTEMSGDMEHLLQATEIGTVFVDADLKVRRFTPAAVHAFNILDQDIGRPISHITNRFGDANLTDTLREVIETGKPAEREVKLGDSVMLLRALAYVASPGEVSGAVLTTVEVTDLKRAQNDAQRLATRYEGIVQDIDHFMLRWRADDQKVTFCNDAYVALIDQPREQIMGRPLSSLIPREQNESFLTKVAQLKPGEATSFLLNVGETSARPIWHEGTVRAIADGNGSIREYQAIGQDITETTAYRIALEKLSRISFEVKKSHEESIHDLLEIGAEFFGMPLGIFSEIKGQYLTVQAVVGGDSFGAKPGSIVPLTKTYALGFNDSPKPLCISHASATDLSTSEAYQSTGLESYIGQKVIVGSEAFGAISFASRAPRLTPFSELQLSMIRILAESVGRRVERNLALREIERKALDFSLILENVSSKIWFKDEKNTILRLNNAAAKAMGTTIEAASGANTADLFPDMADKYHEDDVKVLSQKNERLLTINDSLKQFAHVASHDLQEPLRKLMQFTEYLVQDCSDDLTDDGRYFLSVISSSAERMRRLVRDILSLSSASGNEMNVVTIDLSAMVKELKNDFDVTISETNAEVKIGKLPKIQGDAILVEQLFKNLISNGLKYQSGEQPPLINITGSSRGEGEVLITVTDNGIGMDAENIGKVFDPFTRLHDRKEFDGTGIGLALCRTVCDRHGWYLRAESTLGKGTTFRVIIPQTKTTKS